jgi:hypothetical protein
LNFEQEATILGFQAALSLSGVVVLISTATFNISLVLPTPERVTTLANVVMSNTNNLTQIPRGITDPG